MELSIFVLNEEIKKIENNIDWLQKKNLDHQSFINGNNQRIEELNKSLKELEDAKKILTK